MSALLLRQWRCSSNSRVLRRHIEIVPPFTDVFLDVTKTLTRNVLAELSRNAVFGTMMQDNVWIRLLDMPANNMFSFGIRVLQKDVYAKDDMSKSELIRSAGCSGC